MWEFSVLEKKGLVRETMSCPSPLGRQKHGYPFLWFPHTWVSHGAPQTQEILHLGLLRSVPYTDITQGTGHSLVLMRPEALPPCGAFRLSQQSLSTQEPPLLFCFFSPSVNMSGTWFSCLNTGPTYFTELSKNTGERASLPFPLQAQGSNQEPCACLKELQCFIHSPSKCSFKCRNWPNMGIDLQSQVRGLRNWVSLRPVISLYKTPSQRIASKRDTRRYSNWHCEL